LIRPEQRSELRCFLHTTTCSPSAHRLNSSDSRLSNLIQRANRNLGTLNPLSWLWRSMHSFQCPTKKIQRASKICGELEGLSRSIWSLWFCRCTPLAALHLHPLVPILSRSAASPVGNSTKPQCHAEPIPRGVFLQEMKMRCTGYVHFLSFLLSSLSTSLRCGESALKLARVAPPNRVINCRTRYRMRAPSKSTLLAN
jgi:hypothetical protein